MQLKGWSICRGFWWSVCREFAWSVSRGFRWSVSADFPVSDNLDTFSIDEKGDIDEIAFQCPVTGGPAVYLARSMREQYDTLYYYDDEVCSTQSKEIANANDIEFFGLYPNPSNDLVNIVLPGVQSQLKEVWISDIQGKTCMHYPSVKGKILTISLSSLSGSVYICNVKTQNGTIMTKKLVILK